VAPHSSLQPGFGDAVAQSQSLFRLAMEAMARPGSILGVSLDLQPPAPLDRTAAALLLTLCDFETPIWLDAILADTPGVAEFVRFHTGARLVDAPAEATYAVVADAQGMLPLASFAQGTPEYPDRSATLIVQVARLQAAGWKLEGPGIRGHALFSASPLSADFVHQARANRGQFPCAVDMFFTTRTALAALPRSTRLTEAA
jgi:alpha-D-ribose 1-methylphosphonate 5-triphosphate synthase subunit PhnH